MDENLFGQSGAHCFKHDRPVHSMEFKDILADDVQVGRPLRYSGALRSPWRQERRWHARITLGRWHADVIAQGIEPNISDILGVKRQGDAPV